MIFKTQSISIIYKYRIWEPCRTKWFFYKFLEAKMWNWRKKCWIIHIFYTTNKFVDKSYTFKNFQFAINIFSQISQPFPWCIQDHVKVWVTILKNFPHCVVCKYSQLSPNDPYFSTFNLFETHSRGSSFLKNCFSMSNPTTLLKYTTSIPLLLRSRGSSPTLWPDRSALLTRSTLRYKI